MASDEFSLTVDGPVVLNDHSLIEQIANVNRERIAECRPHAKGSGAFGWFEVTGDVSSYTRAAVFQPVPETDTLIRFSTVDGERAFGYWKNVDKETGDRIEQAVRAGQS